MYNFLILLLCYLLSTAAFVSLVSISVHFFKAEGIFRINAENSKEEQVRNQLSRGFVPRGIDVHCLAGLIKVLTRKHFIVLLFCINMVST